MPPLVKGLPNGLIDEPLSLQPDRDFALSCKPGLVTACEYAKPLALP